MEAEIKKQQSIQSNQLLKLEYVLGIVAIISVFILGSVLLKTDMLFFRLLIGVGLGYTLTRAYTGFAGSINRAYATGSTKLLRAMALMFFVTTLATTTFLLYSNPTNYDLWINPINVGLIAGGLLFGFGMAFSSCCASGVLTDLATGFPRALITLLFFGIGIFIGFPIQHTASWVSDSWFSTSIGSQLQGGVFLPDLFKWDGLNGYVGSILLTALFCGITVYFAYRYERKRKQQNRYMEHETEKLQEQPDTFDSKDYKLFSQATYNRVFIKPWSLKQGAIVISVLFVLLMGVTKAGWGASTPFGIWFGKIVMFLGVSPESVASFTKMSADPFVLPFFEHPVSVQNFGILVGTVIYLLTAGKMKTMFLQGAHIQKREAALFALGGITMGLGTRLANGCNVGALFTPIANFSLSGWIFFIFLALGGIIGNMLAKRLF
ncbi:YeeE/YedE family protein [Virgibacillus sp.]|uniref:YeeE/YedE family protein n=1 Tax=Virgibacillus sp. TaxID=1872700 RepID=UPI0025FBE0D8|nr:YeeE/YedE family protein [Virgibacillus sp.]